MKMKFTDKMPTKPGALLSLCALMASVSSVTAIAAQPSTTEPAQHIQAEAFDLAQVRLLNGPFKRAMDLDAKYLLELEPDRLLAGYREVAGLPAKAQKYGGWESTGLAGHILGHYLSACAMIYQSTGDDRFKQRVDYIVDELEICQKANGNGFVGGLPDGKRIFDEVARGKIDIANGINGGWVPWYNLHKEYAGLRDAYLYTHSAKAKTVLVGFADWACDLSGKLTDAQFQKMLRAEHGGMNEVMADVYAITGDKKYLALSERFNHKAILDPLMNQKDPLTGVHANTQIPKVIGLAREFELTGDEKYRTGASYFWEDVTGKRSFANGGNSNYESFFPIGKMGSALSWSSSETCNTYNMLKLTQHLFSWNPTARYIDYYERALYNHILASQDPVTGGMTYYMSLLPGSFKVYNSAFDSFWCCVGTGIENHSKYGGQIYSHDADSVWVNLFIASELNWETRGLKIRQETNFPEAGSTTLTININSPTKLDLRIRHPAWAGERMRLAVNGQPFTEVITTDALLPARYISINRTWKSGDQITADFPMDIRSEPMVDDPSKVALFCGPILLAANLKTQDMPDPIADGNQLMFNKSALAKVPVMLASNQPVEGWVKPVPGKPLTFKTSGVGTPEDVELIPFYKANRIRYTVYLDTFTPAEWATKKANFEADRKHEAELVSRTIDSVRPGEQQPEHDHHFKGTATSTGVFNDRAWRDATAEGSFSYQLKVNADQPADLLCTYWGNESGNRNFSIQVDGQTIASQKLDNNKPNAFLTSCIPSRQN